MHDEVARRLVEEFGGQLVKTTGEVELRDGDVGGIAVHLAARVMATAGSGEILVSRTVRDLVVGSDIAVQDRGPHTLKGIEGSWQLFAVTEA